jgi:hypothetical protein
MTTIYPPASFIGNLRSPFNQQAVTGAALPLFVASKTVYSTPATLATAGHVTAIAQTLSGAKNLQDGLQLAAGQLVTAVSISGALIEDSDAVLATQKATKAYIDNSPGNLLTTGDERIVETALPVGVLDFYTDNLLRMKLTASSFIYTPWTINMATPRLELLDTTAGHSWVQRLTGATFEDRYDGNVVGSQSSTQAIHYTPLKVSSATQPQLVIEQGAHTASADLSAAGVLSTNGQSSYDIGSALTLTKSTPTLSFVNTASAHTWQQRFNGTTLESYDDAAILSAHSTARMTLYTPLKINMATPIIRFTDTVTPHDWEQRLTGTTFSDYLDNVLIRSINGTREEVFKPLRVTSSATPQIEIFNGVATSSLDVSGGGVLHIAASAHIETLADTWVVAPKPSLVMTDTITGDSFRTEVDATAMQVYHGVDKLTILTPTQYSSNQPFAVVNGAYSTTIATDALTHQGSITTTSAFPLRIPTGIQLAGAGPVYNNLTVDANQNFIVATPRWKHANATSFLRGLGASAAVQSQFGSLNYYAWEFGTAMTTELYANIQMPVDIVASNASMVAIFNWSTTSTALGNCHWIVNMSVASPGAVHAASTYTIDLAAPTINVPYTNIRSLALPTTIVTPVKGASIMMRIRRYRDAYDTLSANVWLLSLTMAYTANKLIGDSAAL